MYWSLLSVVALAVASTGVSGQTADSYFSVEPSIAKAGIFANIGPGPRSQGAKPGIVIASPSRTDPDYAYMWIRDAALVMRALIDSYSLQPDNKSRSVIDDYVKEQGEIQKVPNPSGDITTGGLGEPKFNVDGTAFTGNWGRPQRDGPALRATALIAWANVLRNQGNSSYVSGTLWPIIKLDLDYVANSWNKTGFDLWEEVNSSSFFTTAVQHRALREGVNLAKIIGKNDVVSQYTKQADNALCFLQSYWNPAGYMTANTGGGRSGKDVNTILASIHTFDPAARCDAATFQPCSDRALSNLLIYVRSFQFYGINNGIPTNKGRATGRYPEDTYYDGNPWYLATLAVAEQLYDALIVWKQQGSISITVQSLPFFATLSPGVAIGTYTSPSATFNSLITAVKNYADSFVTVVAKYTPPGGALAEQYHRNSGAPVSASDLTWSYASVITAAGARQGKASSWGAKGLTSPSTCQRGGSTVVVSVNVRATTVLGENIYITGSVDGLVKWSTDQALLLSANAYPIWKITVNLPANTSIQYKFIRKFNGAVTWESGSNRQFTTPKSGSFTLNDSWK